jgi:hypothetical protein
VSEAILARVGMARAERARRLGRARSAAPFVAAALALATVAGATYYLVADHSSSSSSTPPASSAPAAKPGSARSVALQGLQGRALLAPECTPIKGPGWVYPIGPPIKGLPPVVANIKSDLYEVFAISYSCSEASAWIRKFYALKIPIKHSGDVTVLKGPPGYYCSAWPDANGRAYAGGCQAKGGGDCKVTKNAYGRPYAKGRGCEITGGKKAFGWNWNVANRRVVFAHDDKGVLHLIHISGSDTNVVFRYLNGSYELQVLNTSGIGYLDGFTWAPSPGWTVTKIKNATGANCSLTRAGKITCAGSVHPPSCLCGADGGTVTIQFTAAPTKKNAGYLFGGSAAQFKVTKMTPVPYLIPGTPEEAAKRDGV